MQQLHDLTDRQTTAAVARNIAWRYALDIRHQPDAYLCERTLRNYRRRTLELGLVEVLFRTLTDKLIQAVGVDTTKQRLDSTAVRSAIRGLTRLGILIEAASKFLRELRRKFPELYVGVNPEVLRKYVERQGDGCFADTRPSESKRRLPEAAQDVYELVEQFRPTKAVGLESFQLLTQVFHEQCELTGNPQALIAVRPPRREDCDGVISPADPDARYNKHRGTGYLVQVMETFAEDDSAPQDTLCSPKPDLITHVAVDKLTMHDQDALAPALDDADKRGLKPKELLADSHYGSNECLTNGRERGVEIISPAMTAKGKLQGKLTLEDFELDSEGRVLRCPAGKEPLETSVADVRIQVLFDPVGCEGCPHRDNCPAAAVGRSERRWQYNHDRVKQRARRVSRVLPLAGRHRGNAVSLQAPNGHGSAASSRPGEGDLHGDATRAGVQYSSRGSRSGGTQVSWKSCRDVRRGNANTKLKATSGLADVQLESRTNRSEKREQNIVEGRFIQPFLSVGA